MTQVKKFDFTGATIFCGIVVHKKKLESKYPDSEFESDIFRKNANTVNGQNDSKS